MCCIPVEGDGRDADNRRSAEHSIHRHSKHAESLLPCELHAVKSVQRLQCQLDHTLERSELRLHRLHPKRELWGCRLLRERADSSRSRNMKSKRTKMSESLKLHVIFERFSSSWTPELPPLYHERQEVKPIFFHVIMGSML